MKEFNIHGRLIKVNPETRETHIEGLVSVPEKSIFVPEKIFIGNEKRSPTRQSGELKKEHCLLLKIDKLQYIYIGKSIYSFHSEAPIESSIFGTADKPFVIDVSGGIYLLEPGIFLSRTTDDPYFYYENLPPIIGKYTNYTGGTWEKFEISGNPQDLTWKPDRSITANFGFEEMTIKRNGKTVTFTGGIMCSIFDDFGALFGIKKIKKKKALQ